MKIFEKNKSIILKILFGISCLMFAIPSILYYINNKTIFEFGMWFRFLLNDGSRIDQTIIYILILCIMSILYFTIVKERKDIFKNIKQVILFIAIISLVFVIVIPFTCSDVFYYLGIGRISGTYHQNPYYVTIKEFVEQGDNSNYLKQDTVLAQGYLNDWSNSTVVYGPVWTFICQSISIMSFGNIDVGLLIFKLINLLVHILNCYLIYKISNKKIFVLSYGLNPFILIEGIACVHNDMFVILFTLASLYFLLKKKKIVLSLIFLALATAIKYFTVLLLPFIMIYYVRKEKTSVRFLKCMKYGIGFVAILSIFYLGYIRDIQVLSGLVIQQEKLAKSFYITISEYFTEPEGLVKIINKTLLISFAIVYFFTCLTLLNKKEIKFGKEIKKANYFIAAFLFLLITNFQPWYIMWLFPCLMWMKADDVKLIIQISLISQFANSIFLTYGEAWVYGTPFVVFMLLGTLMSVFYNTRIDKNKKVLN